MYLQKKDYQIRIRIDLLDILLQNVIAAIAVAGEAETPETLLAAADKIATDTIATKVGVLYQILPEFAKVGNDRNGYILAMAISIALYELYQRADDYNVPEKVIKNYNDTMDALDAIAKGKENINLPPVISDTGGNGGNGEDADISGIGLRRIGSRKKRSHII